MRKNVETTAYREGLKTKIMEYAMPLFKRYGVKAVKMDDIATDLGISKRTLYEIYSNKEDLLYECVKHDRDRMRLEMSEYSTKAENEMDVITYFIRTRLKDFGTLNPRFFIEMNKYASILDFLQKDNDKHWAESGAFMKSGVEHGFFKNDLNYDIVHEIEEATMDYVMKTRMYERYPLKEIFRTFVIMYLRGCCTEKGIKYLEDLLDDESWQTEE